MERHVHSHHYSLAEARAELARVRGLVEEMIGLKKKLDERGFDIERHEYFGGSGPNGDRYYPPEVERIVEIAMDFNERGILIKGFDVGLIDFPTIRSKGEEVYLCWKAGEPDILFWHRIPDGFAGRKPIGEL
jgi:hypothetical protein